MRSVTTAPRGFEGEGFPVHRAFAGVDLSLLDPFIHMDQMGEVEYAPGEPKGTAWHPHRGFETVTYMLDGVFDHQDSHGGGGTISNGDTQWMTAGGGILHIEKPPEWLVAGRRPVPRHPAVGEPAAGSEVRRPALPGPSRRTGGAAHHAGRGSPDPGHRRRGRRRPWPWIDVHADDDGARDAGPGRAAWRCPGDGLQRPGLRACGIRHSGCRASAARSPGSSRCSARATTSSARADRSRRAGTPRSRFWCSAAARSASRWRGAAPS